MKIKYEADQLNQRVQENVRDGQTQADTIVNC